MSTTLEKQQIALNEFVLRFANQFEQLATNSIDQSHCAVLQCEPIYIFFKSV